MFFPAGAGVRGNVRMGGVFGAKGPSQELLAAQFQAVRYGKDGGFCVDVVNCCHFESASGRSEGCILYRLEFFARSGWKYLETRLERRNEGWS